MRWSLLLALLFSALSQCSAFAEPPVGSALTALDEYVAQPDTTYSWEAHGTSTQDGLTTTAIKLRSQTWRTISDVDFPVWEHWLMVTRPETPSTNRVFLLVGGGGRSSDAPKGPDAITAAICRATGGVVAELKNIPNQPLIFHGDGKPRSEDDLIGYAWAQYLQTGDATWLPRLPMVKSVVRAMDCIEEFSKSAAGGKREVDGFVVAGGSKRGWTTWMSAAADKRIVAMVPIVIDVANVEESLRHHAEAYGFWSEAIGNYYQHNILQQFHHPRMKDLYSIVDPYFYRGRLTAPKYIVNASGDQFFLPDSSQFYFDRLPGEKLLRYVPNADHGLKNSDAVQSIAAFYHVVNTRGKFPQYTWRFEDDSTIRVQTQSRPLHAVFWQANNPTARDFRLAKIGPAFVPTELQPDESGNFVSPKTPVQAGWTASFIELTYDVGAAFPLKVSSAVLVTPSQLPFDDIDLTKVEYEPLKIKQK